MVDLPRYVTFELMGSDSNRIVAGFFSFGNPNSNKYMKDSHLQNINSFNIIMNYFKNHCKAAGML